jgi:hypothetical protein
MPDQAGIPEFTREDFIDGTAPYEFLYRLKDSAFEHSQMLVKMTQLAKTHGVISFKKVYESYCKQVGLATARPVGNQSDFAEQKLELNTGKWIASEMGIMTLTNFGEQVACPHPIMPVERLVNIDTGTEKLRLAFKKGNRWREVITEKSVLASPNSIIHLADNGVSVTSETAKALISYLQDVENLNYDQIPEKRSVGRLGWIHDGEFSPFVPDIIFDGEANFRALFESVRSGGKFADWLAIASEVRRGSQTARIVMAASFASALVGPCGCLPFFVHLWGAESGTGKTVALMAAASVWACPVVGQYIQTFNSTVVSRERMAAFFNSLPMMIDELQLSKDNRGKQQFDVYQLAEGVGKGRGTRHGGVERTSTWANCIITTGESPIVQTGAGAGAVNRVIDIECQEAEPVITDGHRVSSLVKQHYGHAGREFVSRLDADGIAEARRLYQKYFSELTRGDTTEKQAMAAALIITADELATDWIFHDDSNVTVQEIRQFLATKAQVSATIRGYEYLCDWVSQNSARFTDKQDGQMYGTLYGEYAYIINSVFNKACEDAGLSATAMMSWMDKNKLIRKQAGKRTCVQKINGLSTRCIAMKLPPDEPLDI